jgi:HK97 family phage prohead protease
MNLAYSLLTIKSLDSAARTFTGIATTPSMDRMGDVVDPEGAQFRLPVPLLLHHDNHQPVGTVTAADVRRSGITVTGRIAAIDEPGTVKDRCDEAFHSLKAGLIRGLSIGFRPLADGVEAMRGGGMRFKAWEWLELSLVPIPANADCSIQTVKAYAAARRRGGGIPLIKPRPGSVQLIKARGRY